MIKKVNSTRSGRGKKSPFKNMNTQDRDNVRKIENERARLASVVNDEHYVSGGLSLNVCGRVVDIKLERQKKGEYTCIFYVFTRFSELEKKTVIESLAIASLESLFLTSNDIYKLSKAGLKALNARGW